MIIDLDDHLLLYENSSLVGREKYALAIPNHEEINITNKFYDDGHIIIIHNGRNWDKYIFTKTQLDTFDIRYHELVMGKPQGIYVDKNSIKSLKDLYR